MQGLRTTVNWDDVFFLWLKISAINSSIVANTTWLKIIKFLDWKRGCYALASHRAIIEICSCCIRKTRSDLREPWVNLTAHRGKRQHVMQRTTQEQTTLSGLSWVLFRFQTVSQKLSVLALGIKNHQCTSTILYWTMYKVEKYISLEAKFLLALKQRRWPLG